MKKILVMLLTVLCVISLVACGNTDVATESAENVDDAVKTDENIIDDEPVVTAEPTVEVTPAPTEEPTTEATPAPTEEPTPAPTENPYPGIDMESELPGIEWIETFVGVIDEPKVVIYSDITGRKQIVEEKDKVFINPEEDIIAVYLPEEYKILGKFLGIYVESLTDGKHSQSIVLDKEKTMEKKFRKAAVYVEHVGEEIEIGFTIQTQE